MSTELTEAERAAADVLLYEEGSEWAEGTERHEELARAVVAAVRPIIARETLCEEAAYLRDHRRDDNGAFDLWKMYEAGGPEWLAGRAAFHRDNP